MPTRARPTRRCRAQLLFLSGVMLIIGPSKTYRFFFQARKAKGTACFLGGIFLVLYGWAMVGICVEGFGFLNLFGDFFPIALGFLRNMPIIGHVLSLVRGPHHYAPDLPRSLLLRLTPPHTLPPPAHIPARPSPTRSLSCAPSPTDSSRRAGCPCRRGHGQVDALRRVLALLRAGCRRAPGRSSDAAPRAARGCRAAMRSPD